MTKIPDNETLVDKVRKGNKTAKMTDPTPHVKIKPLNLNWIPLKKYDVRFVLGEPVTEPVDDDHDTRTFWQNLTGAPRPQLPVVCKICGSQMVIVTIDTRTIYLGIKEQRIEKVNRLRINGSDYYGGYCTNCGHRYINYSFSGCNEEIDKEFSK